MIEEMAALPVGLPASPRGRAQERARFFNSANAFNVKLPPVPPARFTEELEAARRASGTAAFACDQSEAIGTAFPATTPLMLARYVAIAPNATYASEFIATGAIWYVIAGTGHAVAGDDRIEWGEGDVVLSPGGVTIAFSAGANGGLLWVVTNEPQLAFDRLAPAPTAEPALELVHYPAGEIARQLARVVASSAGETTSGVALIFSNEREEGSRNIMPSLTLSLNTVPAGEHQREHRHNSAAITLIVQGDRAYSLVGGVRCDWSPYATLVTPATDPHSHHNDGSERAMFLIVQDGGLHYHARTMGFTFLEAPE